MKRWTLALALAWFLSAPMGVYANELFLGTITVTLDGSWSYTVEEREDGSEEVVWSVPAVDFPIGTVYHGWYGYEAPTIDTSTGLTGFELSFGAPNVFAAVPLWEPLRLGVNNFWFDNPFSPLITVENGHVTKFEWGRQSGAAMFLLKERFGMSTDVPRIGGYEDYCRLDCFFLATGSVAYGDPFLYRVPEPTSLVGLLICVTALVALAGHRMRSCKPIQ